jgi:hypothetical protein
MIVTVTKEHNSLPEGSGVHVTRELKYTYVGIWVSMLGSYEVRVKKKHCKIKSL